MRDGKFEASDLSSFHIWHIDSETKEPMMIGGEPELLAHLNALLAAEREKMLVVYFGKTADKVEDGHAQYFSSVRFPGDNLTARLCDIRELK
jgi:hypothetical protein